MKCTRCQKESNHMYCSECSCDSMQSYMIDAVREIVGMLEENQQTIMNKPVIDELIDDIKKTFSLEV